MAARTPHRYKIRSEVQFEGAKSNKGKPLPVGGKLKILIGPAVGPRTLINQWSRVAEVDLDLLRERGQRVAASVHHRASGRLLEHFKTGTIHELMTRAEQGAEIAPRVWIDATTAELQDVALWMYLESNLDEVEREGDQAPEVPRFAL